LQKLFLFEKTNGNCRLAVPSAHRTRLSAAIAARAAASSAAKARIPLAFSRGRRCHEVTDEVLIKNPIFLPSAHRAWLSAAIADRATAPSSAAARIPLAFSRAPIRESVRRCHEVTDEVLIKNPIFLPSARRARLSAAIADRTVAPSTAKARIPSAFSRGRRCHEVTDEVLIKILIFLPSADGATLFPLHKGERCPFSLFERKRTKKKQTNVPFDRLCVWERYAESPKTCVRKFTS